MPAVAAPETRSKSKCGAGPGGFQSGNSCARRVKEHVADKLRRGPDGGSPRDKFDQTHKIVDKLLNARDKARPGSDAQKSIIAARKKVAPIAVATEKARRAGLAKDKADAAKPETLKTKADAPEAKAPKVKGSEADRLKALASRAQARHEQLRKSGASESDVNAATDRAIAIKRRAHAERTARVKKLVAERLAKHGAVPKGETDPESKATGTELVPTKGKPPALDLKAQAAAHRASKGPDTLRARTLMALAKKRADAAGRKAKGEIKKAGPHSEGIAKEATAAVEHQGKRLERLVPHAAPEASKPAGPKWITPDRVTDVGESRPGPKALDAPPASKRISDAAVRSKVAERLRAMRGKAAVDPASHTNHAPGHIGDLNTDLIHADPARFQYKMGQTDAKTGITDALHGVNKWDPELGGIVQVWKDPKDGHPYIVNGHHRLALAKKLGAKKIAARFIDAADHVEARSKGALTNIAEGRGTSTDAGRFFKDRNIGRADVEKLGVPLRERIAHEGLALAGLHQPIFDKVVTGEMTPARGAVIGGSGLTPSQQMDLMKHAEAKGAKGLSDRDLREFIDNARAAGSTTKTTKSLFGDDEEEIALGGHRARVQGHIKDRLSKEKRLFGTVAKSKNAGNLERGGNKIDTEESGKISEAAAHALGIFDALKNSAGPISGHLNRAAQRLAAGHRSKDVHDETYRAILASLEDATKF